jgi:[ribosomal protein S5]-alanine N-acetyltransferase
MAPAGEVSGAQIAARLAAIAPTMRLLTPRLALRRLDTRDEAAAIAHELDHRIMRWIRDPQPIEAIRERTQRLLSPWRGEEGAFLAMAVTLRDADSMLGILVARFASIADVTMEVGYRLHPDVHRKGYAFEAMSRWIDFLCDDQSVRKLTAWVAAPNEPSWRLLEKLGFSLEATFREHTQLAGEWIDERVYGLLARERRSAQK